jgi:hypothetical protein
MVDYVKWAKENYPAQKYVLVVWNHGSGWSKDMTFEAAKGISYDDETGHHITTPELRQALAAAGQIDILSMDACLMQMVEVAYEVKGLTDYVVASEETEPGDGYTYDTFLGPLAGNPGMDAAALSKAMVDAYTDHYQAMGQDATQSAIKVAALDGFVNYVNGFVDSLITAGDRAVAKSAMAKTQSFYYASNKDLYHFAKLVGETTANADVARAAKELMGFMTSDLISHNRANGSKYANAFGIAAYMPGYYNASYDVLLWAKDSKWDDFIKWAK